ncbi:MAG: flagellar hook-length control protein FliK [Agathobacter sp.]|nr:flagellar hook-length control protein FliK [Agathobacter sp.]
MTTANLMNVPSVNAKFAPQTEASKKLQDEELKVAEMFAGLVNQTAIVSNQVVDETSSNTDVKVNSTQSAAESYERYSYKDNQIEAAQDPSVEEQLEEVAEDLEQAETEVLNAICEEYGVSEEEIQSLLDDMGLSVLDLLNPENLVNFIMQLTGITSSEELLLDESFLTIMETMDSLAEGLMKDLNVDMEGLQELVNQMELVSEETQLPEDFQQIIETAVENTNTEETVDNAVETTQTVDEATQVVEETTETVEETSKTVEDEKEIQVEIKDETSEGKTTEVKTEEQDAFTNNQNSENNSMLNHNSNTDNLVTNQPNVTVNTIADMAQTQFSSYLGTETVQIIEQIVQQMKVTISAETTSMEMQLNPENLGKVYVKISSEEGVVNAQFHATNEVVKEALEAQVATLRENLNQAGVKVDAIEVTIASHEFERNLEQNHQNPEEAAETKDNQNGKRRNITIDSLDEISGLMTEEETLVAQMMKENGNSVDFTA